MVRKLASMRPSQVAEGEAFWRAPVAVMAARLRESPVRARPVVVRLLERLDAISGDEVDLGIAASGAKAEVGKPSSAIGARRRRMR